MSESRWWERYPDRLATEKKSLDDLGIDWKEDRAAVAVGVMRLNLPAVDVAGERVDLVVTYPDHYPYFRFEVYAPGLSLQHHQNPFGKNLCLMGRSTYNWHVNDTIGTIIQTQLRNLLKAARTHDTKEAAELEEHQAEPASEYYSYCPGSIVLIERPVAIDASARSGRFRIGLRDEIEPTLERPPRGLLTAVYDDTGQKMFEASEGLRKLYNGRALKGRWIRLDEPPPAEKDGLIDIDYLHRHDQGFNRFEQGNNLVVGAIVFPEEQSWRAAASDGWLFVCEFRLDSKRHGSK